MTIKLLNINEHLLFQPAVEWSDFTLVYIYLPINLSIHIQGQVKVGTAVHIKNNTIIIK